MIEQLQHQIKLHREVQNSNTKLILDSIQKWIDDLNINDYVGKTDLLEAKLFWHNETLNNISYNRQEG